MSDGSRPAESAEIDGSGIGASGGANKIGGERGERREQGRQLGWEGRGACRTAGAGRARSSGICGRVRGRARGGAARRSGGAGEQGRRRWGRGIRHRSRTCKDHRESGGPARWGATAAGAGAGVRADAIDEGAAERAEPTRPADRRGFSAWRGPGAPWGVARPGEGGAAAVQTCSTGRRTDQRAGSPL